MKYVILTAALTLLTSFHVFAGTESSQTKALNPSNEISTKTSEIEKVAILAENPEFGVREASLLVLGRNGSSCHISSSLIKKQGLDLETLASLLTSAGFSITCVNDPTEAMKTIKVVGILR